MALEEIALEAIEEEEEHSNKITLEELVRKSNAHMQEVAKLAKDLSSKSHVMLVQLIGKQGSGKTNVIQWFKKDVFPDYSFTYLKKPSPYEANRILHNIGVEGQTDYCIAIDDISFIWQNDAQIDHDFEILLNTITDLRHVIAPNAKVSDDDLRIVVALGHHYFSSIGPYLRQADMHFLFSLQSKEQKKQMEAVFPKHKLNRFYRSYGKFMYSAAARLDLKLVAPVLVKAFHKESVLWFHRCECELRPANKQTTLEDRFKSAKEAKQEEANIAILGLLQTIGATQARPIEELWEIDLEGAKERVIAFLLECKAKQPELLAWLRRYIDDFRIDTRNKKILAILGLRDTGHGTDLIADLDNSTGMQGVPEIPNYQGVRTSSEQT